MKIGILAAYLQFLLSVLIVGRHLLLFLPTFSAVIQKTLMLLLVAGVY